MQNRYYPFLSPFPDPLPMISCRIMDCVFSYFLRCHGKYPLLTSGRGFALPLGLRTPWDSSGSSERGLMFLTGVLECSFASGLFLGCVEISLYSHNLMQNLLLYGCTCSKSNPHLHIEDKQKKIHVQK